MLMSYFILARKRSQMYFIFANIVPDFEIFHLASQPLLSERFISVQERKSQNSGDIK